MENKTGKYTFQNNFYVDNLINLSVSKLILPITTVTIFVINVFHC